MKFYRMTNGDIVTSIRPVTGTPGIKATRVYDATNKTYCFEERAYRGSLYAIKEQLKKDSAVCLRNQLDTTIKQNTPEPNPREGIENKPWFEDLKDRALGLFP